LVELHLNRPFAALGQKKKKKDRIIENGNNLLTFSPSASLALQPEKTWRFCNLVQGSLEKWAFFFLFEFSSAAVKISV